MNFNKFLTKLLGNDKKIEEVQVDQKVIDEIVKIARNADPNEYVALLSGKREKQILKITGLIFLPYAASNTSAVMQIFMKPMTTTAVGSVHSHPGPSNMPSDADLQFFSQNGFFHMIICQPYTPYTIGSYDQAGNPIPFTIKDLGEDVDIKNLEDFDIDDDFDEEFLKEMKEDDDEDDDVKSTDIYHQDLINQIPNSTQPTNISENISMSQDYIENNDKNIDSSVDKNIDNNNNDKSEDENMQQDEQPQDANIIELQIEVGDELITKKIPLPPEYQPGDDIEVSICTDKTPGDSIDEISLNVIKQGVSMDNNHVIDITPETKEIESKQVEEPAKSSTEIEEEIKAMEADIEKLKEENERLKKLNNE